MAMPWEVKPLDRTETKLPGVPNFLVREPSPATNLPAKAPVALLPWEPKT